MLQSNRVINPIFNVNFAGMQSHSIDLQRNGWSMSVEREKCYGGMRVVFEHRVFGIAMLGFIDERTRLKLASYTDFLDMMNDIPTVKITHTMNRGQNYLVSEFSPQSMVSVDAMPQIVERKETIYSYDTFMELFAIPHTRTEELIVNPNEVGHYLELIRKAQEPKQAEIREKIAKYKNKTETPQVKFHAQILSFA